ncbi:Dfp1/Him1, central region-domain-containing protein [Geopyxis carbonaria]|nr:Dfp1/Him1, central region-domain-containing protein [Geopyxis carbonaria]
MSRRPPLTNLPNAVNSPYQITTTTSKRSRSQSGVNRDISYGQPPSKKQAVHRDVSYGQPSKKQVTESIRTPVRRSVGVADGRVGPPKRTTVRTRPAAGGPPAFADIGQQRKPPPRTTTEVQQQDNLETIRAWQRHYRKAFPTYIFFFESIPHDVISKAQKHISHLGATYEKFFSSKVTHVITTRTIPSEEAPLSVGSGTRPNVGDLITAENNIYTDNITKECKCIKSVYSRRVGRGGGDILLKAREYGMKIWALDKLQRVLNGLLDIPIHNPSLVSACDRNGRGVQPYDARVQPNVDLSHLLRNERLHGPTERDSNTNPRDLHHFKGPFIYIRDVTGTTRPIIVREYPKVPRREDGTWPQFRSVSGGKCPFVEEKEHQRRDKDRTQEKARDKEVPPLAKESTGLERSISSSRTQVARHKRISTQNGAMDARDNQRAAMMRPAPKGSQSTATVPAKRLGYRQENSIAFTATNGQNPSRYTQEPAASGVQPSNITSAIRSQVVSSHPDQPGQRGGTSREIYGLQRKVAGNVLLANPNSRLNDAKKSVDGKITKKRCSDGKEKPGRLEEKDQIVSFKVERNGENIAPNKRQVKQESRPGYCENCREKFEDFEEHTVSRKHRKFATDNKNWAELDDLLSKLHRPMNKQVQRL